MFSVPHMVVLFVVVLVVFGPHKLPELARGLGKLMAEFRKASTDFKLAFEEEMRNMERQAREAERKKQMDAAAASAATRERAPPRRRPRGRQTRRYMPDCRSSVDGLAPDFTRMVAAVAVLPESDAV